MKLYKIPKIPRFTLGLWWFCRIGLLVWGVIMLCLGHPVQFLQAVFGTIFTGLWDYFQLLGQRTFIARVPYQLQTNLNVFIFLGCVVGTSINMFTEFAYIDIPSHFYAGFLSAAFGYDLAFLLQNKRGNLSPALAAMFGFSAAVTMLVGWEIYEFSMDRIYGLNLQRYIPDGGYGLIDTMKDLIIGASGALAGMFVTVYQRNSKSKREKK